MTTSPPSDEAAFLERIASADEYAFRELYGRYAGRVRDLPPDPVAEHGPRTGPEEPCWIAVRIEQGIRFRGLPGLVQSLQRRLRRRRNPLDRSPEPERR